MKKVKKALAAFVAVTMIFAAGCAEKRNGAGNNVVYYNNSNTYSQAAEGVEDSEGQVVREEDRIENIPTTPAKQGELSQISGLDVKLTNVYNIGTIKAGEVFNYDRQVLACVYEITNNTDKEIDVSAFDMSVKYMDGEITTVTTGVEAMLRAGEKIKDIESFNSTLKPGETLRGYTAFSVYSRWNNLTIYYSPSAFDSKDSLAYDVTQDMVEDYN